ncbi:PAS domain S-box protein [Lutibacter holmesii]|uniref:histidine kinase n=1 Tax=Lutibacter holmesii TaxID=1137985 RepID=A0ABW3WQM6_9FLAO
MNTEAILHEDLTKSELLSIINKQEKTIYALQHNDRKYDNLFNNSIDGIYKSTPEGKFIDVNTALVKMLGYNSKEELLQINIKKQLYVNGNDRNEIIDHFYDTTKEQHQLYKKDGSIIWVENYGVDITNSNGEVLYYEGIFRDVTEIKKASDIQKMLLKISQVGHDIVDFKQYNRFIIEQLGTLMDVSNSYIAFYNKAKQTINIPFISGEDAEEEFPVGKSMTGYLIKGKVSRLIKAKEYTALIDAGEVDLIGTFAQVWLGVPLIVEGEVIGALVVQSYDDENAYNESDIELLEFVSSYISTAIQKSQQILELKKFSLAVEQSSNTIVITDTKGSIEYVNSKFKKSTGYTKEEALGANPRILNSGNQPKKYYANMWKTISSGKEWIGEFQNKSKQGKLYWERVAITPITNHEGVITNYMAIKEDVTLQKLTEEKLKKATNEARLSQEVLRNVFDNIPIKVFWKDVDSKYLGCNKAYLKEKGLSDEMEMIGKTDFDIHKKEDATKYRADEVKIMLSGKPKINYQESSFYSGKERWFVASKLPFYDENNNVIGIIGTSEDITKRRENEIQLKKATESAIAANLSKSVFLSNMSHEIRTPMNAILGYSQLLQDDDNLTKNQQGNLEIINKSGAHLLDLINDILDMSKIEAGRITLKPNDFSLAEMLNEVEQLFNFKASQNNIDLTFKTLNNIPRIILGDESKIKQVIINLVGNALKFTKKGFVHINVEKCKDNFIKISVKDSGKGIALEEQEAIFRPFEQAQIGGETSGGTGLGLAISKKFSHLMGGDITIESELGKGANFVFTFGYEDSEETVLTDNLENKKIKSLSSETLGLKVAIVDDRFENRDILYQKLNPLGFDLRMAENGKEAVELYKEWKPDLILMDVVMPVMSGVDATREIFKIAGDHDVKIFIISASALESEQKEVMEIGATIFIKKPVIFNELLTEMSDKGGVKFIYEDIIEKEIVDGKSTEIIGNTKEQFIEAALEGDFVLLQELLIELENDTGKSFKYLENCIEEFEFEELINWLKS